MALDSAQDAALCRLNRALLVAPLPGSAPAGPSLREAGLYEELREATRWQVADSVFGIAEKSPQWALAAARAREVLETQSRDLYLAVVYAEAAAYACGPQGLADGLFAVHALYAHHAQHFHPPSSDGRHEARLRLLQLLARKLDSLLRAWCAAATSHSASGSLAAGAPWLREAAAQLNDLTRLARAAYGESYDQAGVSFATHGETLAELADRIEGLGEVVARASSASPALGVAATRSMLQTSSSTVDHEAQLATHATLLRTHRPQHPLGYIIPRALRWSEVSARASNAQAGTLPSPDSATRSTLAQLFAGELWVELLHTAEDTFSDSPAGPTWLDLQRYSAAALRMLGPDYADARRSVVATLADLIERCPSLLTTCTSDGSPVADDVTRAWIATEVGAKPRPCEATTKEIRATTVDPEISAAHAGYTAGRVEESLEGLRRAAESAVDGRSRYVRLRALAELHLAGKQPLAAAGLLQRLVRVGRQHDLATWEGSAFAAHTLSLLVRAYADLRARGDGGLVLAARCFDAEEELAGLDPLQPQAAQSP